MSDISFRKMGIKITAAKQITEVIHVILETFYGEETVRANISNTVAEPYNLEDGMDFIFALEDGIERVLTFNSTDFININQAKASEVAAVFTRFVRTQKLNSFAKIFNDLATNEIYIKLFGGAKGPYSTVTVLGGEANTVLRFPNVRGTELDVNDTAWEITRTVGSTLRFRWVGNSKPALSLIYPDDRVMIYGQNFKDFELDGTFVVKNVRPPLAGPDLDAGWFEIENDAFAGIRSTQAGTAPPANVPPDTFYSYTVIQASFNDLMFMKPVKALPNRQIRYALAWEPADALLRIYMPATTSIVSRGLVGASHLHLLYSKTNLNGVYGSETDLSSAVEVISDRAIRYKQFGYDNNGTGGVLTWDANEIEIDYVKREQFRTTVICKEPHGLPVTVDSSGISKTLKIVDIEVALVPEDLTTFPSPYVVDTEAPYAIRSEFVTSRSKVFAGSTLTTLEVDGILPNKPGELLFDLNKDTQEGPVRYIGVQAQNAPNVVNITSISQNALVLTITTNSPHGAIPNSFVTVAGTSVFDGVYEVNNVPNATTMVAIAVAPQVASQVGVGTVSVIVDNPRSTLLLDPSNRFRFDHEIGADLTLMSSRFAYEPASDGKDYPFYVTGVAEGRVFAEEVIESITALGINLEIIIVYPSDVGLGNQGGSDNTDNPPASDKIIVWGV